MFEPWCEVAKRFFDIVLPVLFMAGVSTVFATVPFWNGVRRRFDLVAAVFAFSMIGAVIGVFTGSSRDPVVGAVLPAFLGLLGGLVTYVLGKEESVTKTDEEPHIPKRANGDIRKIAVAVMIGVSLTSLWSAFFGSGLRGNAERQAIFTEQEKAIFEKCLEDYTHPVCNSQ